MLAPALSRWLPHMAQQVQPPGRERFEHGLDREKGDMGFVQRFARCRPIPGLGKPLAHIGQAAHIDLNFVWRGHFSRFLHRQKNQLPVFRIFAAF